MPTTYGAGLRQRRVSDTYPKWAGVVYWFKDNRIGGRPLREEPCEHNHFTERTAKECAKKRFKELTHN